MRAALAALCAVALAARCKGFEVDPKGQKLLDGGMFNVTLLSQCKSDMMAAAGRRLSVSEAMQQDELIQLEEAEEEDAPYMSMQKGVWELFPEQPVLSFAVGPAAVQDDKAGGIDAFKTLRVLQFQCAADVRSVCKVGTANVKSCPEIVFGACPECFPAGTDAAPNKECLCKCEQKGGEVAACFKKRIDQAVRADPPPVNATAYAGAAPLLVAPSSGSATAPPTTGAAPTAQPSVSAAPTTGQPTTGQPTTDRPSSAPTTPATTVKPVKVGRLLRANGGEGEARRALAKEADKRNPNSPGGQKFDQMLPRQQAAGALRSISACFKDKYEQLSASCKAALTKRGKKTPKKLAANTTRSPTTIAPSAAAPPVPTTTRAPSVAAPAPSAGAPAPSAGAPAPSAGAPAPAPSAVAPLPAGARPNPTAPEVLTPIDQAAGALDGAADGDNNLILVAGGVGVSALLLMYGSRKYMQRRKNNEMDQSRAVVASPDMPDKLQVEMHNSPLDDVRESVRHEMNMRMSRTSGTSGKGSHSSPIVMRGSVSGASVIESMRGSVSGGSVAASMRGSVAGSIAGSVASSASAMEDKAANMRKSDSVWDEEEKK
jgi:hypothetical protein